MLKSTGTSLDVLAKGNNDSIQGLQALDNLRINAFGPALTFFLNGKQVSQLNDAAYTGGEIGLYVETFDSPKTHIHFHSLIVRKPEDTSLLYQADFTNPKSGWPDELAFDKYYVGYHEPDFYHVEVHEQNDSAITPIPGRTFDNFAVESDVYISKANTAPAGDFRYGLVFRRAGSHFYAFAVSPRTKTWYVLKSTGTSLDVLAKGNNDSIQGLQALDNLRINAFGPALTFFLNGKQVSQLNDGGYTGGEIGLMSKPSTRPRRTSISTPLSSAHQIAPGRRPRPSPRQERAGAGGDAVVTFSRAGT